MLHIDGSYGEGGGQIIRSAVSLAAITNTPIEIGNIRARREKPGLQPQHLTAVQLMAELCAAEVDGATIGSTWLSFHPHAPVSPGHYRRDIGTAGATALVMQTALLPLALSGGHAHLRVTGGTHNTHAPSVDYLEMVYLPTLRRMGIEAQMRCSRFGFYPRGGGDTLLAVAPTRGIAPIDLTERGALRTITAIITTSGLHTDVAARGAATVIDGIESMGLGEYLVIDPREKPSNGRGAAILLVVDCENSTAGFLALGALGKPMERVVEEACRALAAWWPTGAACDEHLADQLALPLALANAESRWTTPIPTEHLQTVCWLVEQFLPVRFSVTERDGHYLVELRPCSLPLPME